MPRGAAIAVCLMCAATLAAAAVCPSPLVLLVRSTERIVHVRVDSLTVETAAGQPFTRASAKVLDTLKGPRETQLYLRVPGGRVGEFIMVVPGAPTLRAGEEYVAFLVRDDNPAFSQAAWRPFNLGEGLFAVIRKAGRVYAVQAATEAPRLFAACADTPDNCLAQARANGEELSALKIHIREALAQGDP